jgi:hypothetical protein
MEYADGRSIGDLIRDRNIILKGADAATAQGFTQVPNFLLKSKKLSSGDKMAFAMLLLAKGPRRQCCAPCAMPLDSYPKRG